MSEAENLHKANLGHKSRIKALEYQLAEWKQAASGRTVSCSNCNQMAKELVIWRPRAEKHEERQLKWTIKAEKWHGVAKKMADFVKDIRPFLGYEPEATINKRADVLLAAYDSALKDDR